jgi:hypothetical protein
MIYVKTKNDRMFRGLKQSERPEWPGWKLIKDHEEVAKKYAPSHSVDRVLNNILQDDDTLTAMYAVICRGGDS